MEIVDYLAFTAMRDIGNIQRPAYEELPNTFLYRHALGIAVYLLKWIRTGGQRKIRPENIRNDLIDVNFATYATYFDGILTSDKRLLQLFNEMMVLLEMIKHNVKNN